MAKLSARKQATTKTSPPTPRKARDLTFTQQDFTTKETIVLSIKPDTHFTFEGREHQLWISINKYGEPLLRVRHNDHYRMMIISHTDETALSFYDAKGNDAGSLSMNHKGEVECTICKTRRYIEPLFELMTDHAVAQTLSGGVGKFVAAAYQTLLDLPREAFTALSQQIHRTRGQKQVE
jgi:hypothetical protein